MKIAITGATGFVGRNLVPLLHAAGAELLLIGRTPQHISRLFPDISACGYDELAEHAKGFDLLVHLAVVNSDARISDDVFFEVNVRQLLDVADSARRAGIERFVNVSSIHTLDHNNKSAYASSKREATRALATFNGLATSTVYLAAVYAEHWSGKLSVLNKLPKPMAKTLFQILAALKPTMHISRLSGFLLDTAQQGAEEEVILTDGQDNNLVFRFVKRAVDLVFALSVAVFLGWALVLIWAMVRWQSPGPGIFSQQRVGKNGGIFTCYKFRTMRHGITQTATHEASSDAVTSIGRFLRRTKLDELPQIWNILRNEISLVGPRPCLPSQTRLIEARLHRNVLRLKPGITGLAQINNIDMRQPEKLARWDSRYFLLQSLSLDFKIIVATAIGKGRGDPATRR